MTAKAARVLTSLFEAFIDDPRLLPDEARDHSQRLEASMGMPGCARGVADYIAGMTDRYALIEHARHFKSTPELR